MCISEGTVWWYDILWCGILCVYHVVFDVGKWCLCLVMFLYKGGVFPVQD